MKILENRAWLIALGGIIICTLISGCIHSASNEPQENKASTTEQNQEAKIDYQSLFPGEINVSQLFPKEKIEELLGKSLVSIKPTLNKTQRYTVYGCEYRQEETKYSQENNIDITKRISIDFVRGDIGGLKEAYKLTNDKAKQDSSIPFSHQLIYNQKGELLRLEIFLADDLELIINTWSSNLTTEEALRFVKSFASYFKEFVESKSQTESQGASSSSQTGYSAVPLPQDEDLIRNFVNLINGGNADKAALMMKTSNDSERQAWAVQFAAINYIQVLKIEKTDESNWTDNKHIYKLVLDVKMDPRSVNAPIPYYGWQDGENTRWIILEKADNVWKIAEISAGL